jgi:hypothetical protein
MSGGTSHLHPESAALATTQAPPGRPNHQGDDFYVAERPASAPASASRDFRARYLARLRRLARRTTFFRLLGVALVIYGAIGLAAALYAHGLVRDAFASARELGSVADDKQRALRSLQSISTTLADASTASANMRSSFQESQTSLKTSAEVASDVAVAFQQVANTAGFTVFGYQPLAPVAQPFQNSSDRLEKLSEDLTRTSAAVGANANDAQRLAGDFSRMKADIDDLARTVERLPSDPTSGEGAHRLETALSAMLVWIGLQGLAALFGGLALVLYPLRDHPERVAA